MSSSNRHWPSMFRSKPCGNQLQHDSAISPNCHSKPSSTPYSSGLEERSPEPKPRWNPKPEQIRILEAIFYSGMVNPPREEIRKIRVQLQEFGQVGDANVFYWFQNRKSRSKNKLRSSATAARHNPPPPPPPPPQPPPLITTTTTTTTTTPTSSSSSSSEKSSAGSQNTLQAIHSQPPTATTSLMNGQTYLPPDLSGIGDHFLNLQNFVGFPDHGTTLNPTTLWGELLGQTPSKTVRLDHLIYGTGTSTSAAAAAAATTTTTANPINEIQGGGGSSGRSTVFINEVAFEMVAGMPLNVKEAFGGTALLLDHSGRPVITDEWGITIHPLQHGASYYVV